MDEQTIAAARSKAEEVVAKAIFDEQEHSGMDSQREARRAVEYLLYQENRWAIRALVAHKDTAAPELPLEEGSSE